MRLMKLTAAFNPLGKYAAFYLLVMGDGPWDYKNQPFNGANPQYDAFGNFNYGVGRPQDSTHTLYRTRQDECKKGTGGKGKAGIRGNPNSGIAPYGDRPLDNYWIRQGIEYAHEKGY